MLCSNTLYLIVVENSETTNMFQCCRVKICLLLIMMMFRKKVCILFLLIQCNICWCCFVFVRYLNESPSLAPWVFMHMVSSSKFDQLSFRNVILLKSVFMILRWLILYIYITCILSSFLIALQIDIVMLFINDANNVLLRSKQGLHY